MFNVEIPVSNFKMDVCIPEPLGELAHQAQPSDVYANLHLHKTAKLADCVIWKLGKTT